MDMGFQFEKFDLARLEKRLEKSNLDGQPDSAGSAALEPFNSGFHRAGTIAWRYKIQPDASLGQRIGKPAWRIAPRSGFGAPSPSQRGQFFIPPEAGSA
jgi:hypothetical protein